MRRTVRQVNFFRVGSLLLAGALLSVCLSGITPRGGLSPIAPHSATTQEQAAYYRPTKTRQHSLTTRAGTFFPGIESRSKRHLLELAVPQSKCAQVLADNARAWASELPDSPFTLSVIALRPPGRAPPLI